MNKHKAKPSVLSHIESFEQEVLQQRFGKTKALVMAVHGEATQKHGWERVRLVASRTLGCFRPGYGRGA